MKSSLFHALVLPALAYAAVHNVQVGPNGAYAFTPSTITAAVGDDVVFHFVSNGHTVEQGNFQFGCQPGTNGFSSGAKESGQTYTITIMDPSPMSFYCASFGHCEGGMYGVINPSEADTLEAYANLASMAP